MTFKERAMAYAKQIGVSTVGSSKNKTALNKMVGKLTAKQQRRLRKKQNRDG
jgi:hypothetical protein